MVTKLHSLHCLDFAGNIVIHIKPIPSLGWLAPETFLVLSINSNFQDLDKKLV